MNDSDPFSLRVSVQVPKFIAVRMAIESFRTFMDDLAREAAKSQVKLGGKYRQTNDHLPPDRRSTYVVQSIFHGSVAICREIELLNPVGPCVNMLFIPASIFAANFSALDPETGLQPPEIKAQKP